MATNRCRTAYPDKDTAEKAALPVTSASFAPLVSVGDDDDNIESYDPNEVMAKAYHQKSVQERMEGEEKSESTPDIETGPLAFLGLTRTVGQDENVRESFKVVYNI